MKLIFRIRGKEYRLVTAVIPRMEHYVAGITNKCSDGRYILFLDYDDVPQEWVEEELSYIQETYRLGDIQLLRTNNGFHAICLEKFTLHELVNLMQQTSTDDAYLSVPLRRARKVWTLRFTEKNGKRPQYIKTLRSMYHLRPVSKPHAETLRRLYHITIPRTNEDDAENFLTAHYHIARNDT